MALGLAVLALAAGCGVPSERAAAEPPVDETAILRQQARDDLVRYDEAVAKANGGKVVVIPPDWDPSREPPGSIPESTAPAVTVSADGMRLTVTFTGRKDPAAVPCGSDYSAEAVEGANAVVPVVIGHPHARDETCTLVGYLRTATLTLNRPLGKRAVLEVTQGLPVPVKTAS